MAVKAIRKILKDNGHSYGEIQFLIGAIKLIFESNNFTYNDQNYLQICGMSMGSPCAPTICSLTFWAYEGPFILKNPKLLLWKRHIDDIFAIFAGTQKQLDKLIERFKRKSDFTYTQKVSTSEVEFLDLTISKDSKHEISTTVYRHPAKIPVYTHAKSCQSDGVKRAIIRSTCIRFRRICSSNTGYDKESKKLKFQLIDRGYSSNVVGKIIKDVREMKRSDLLVRKDKTDISDNIPRLTINYIPEASMTVTRILKRNWNVIADLFKFSVKVGYRNNITIEDVLKGKTKYPRPKQNYSYVKDEVPGQHVVGNLRDQKCERRSCKTCDEHLTIPQQPNWTIGRVNCRLPEKNIVCETSNVVYMVSCTKCPGHYYIGETGQSLRDRMYGHRTKSSVLYRHFTTNNHSLTDMRVCYLHILRKSTFWLYRKGVEYWYIKALKPILNIDLAPP